MSLCRLPSICVPLSPPDPTPRGAAGVANRKSCEGEEGACTQGRKYIYVVGRKSMDMVAASVRKAPSLIFAESARVVASC